MDDSKRLIEVDFPLRQVSIDSVHEKNVRHGHISTLHIWPARRPLAACRAALIATLLPDPGNDAEREAIYKRMAGELVEVEKIVKGKPTKVYETRGGILHWGRETENAADLQWFRDKIREAYGGRAPKVLDPFAGGGAIPLEAMRLGCEATAIDINPVAWFILKCTLEYPQKLAGQTWPLPDFALASREFMEQYFKKAKGLKGKALERAIAEHFADVDKRDLFPGGTGFQPVDSDAGRQLTRPTEPDRQDACPSNKIIEADLAWHVRAWGLWVLERAREKLAPYYPVIDGKPTVAYLWARTVQCKSCRATIPLLKTRWLCKKDKKRVVLTMEPNADKTGVVFGIDNSVPVTGGNAAQKREFDKKFGAGTMNRSGATCPCCKTIMTMEDLRFAGMADKLGMVMTAVILDGRKGKEYRAPIEIDRVAAEIDKNELHTLFNNLPFGLPQQPTPTQSQFSGVANYGFKSWDKLFTPRQLLVLGVFAQETRRVVDLTQREAAIAVTSFLAAALDRLADRNSMLCWWQTSAEKVASTFTRFALPITWDFSEINPLADSSGGYVQAIEWEAEFLDRALTMVETTAPVILNESGMHARGIADVVLTDPPYYDAIPYSDLMDFFYLWLQRSTYGLTPEMDHSFGNPLSPKWDNENEDGELIDDASRHAGDKEKSKAAYELGMARVFRRCFDLLSPSGRLVVVFAHKQPDAWETLVSAIILAGFVVDGSWPIMTERVGRMRANASAALSSSVWLVCRKRDEDAKAGWDNVVLEEMRERIGTSLKHFWDAGIRGPDFVWSATGPALEAYSKHPVVKKADAPGETLGVGEFLRQVRRIVVDFIVGNVLHGGGDGQMDDVTTYYLLHRHDFGMEAAPAGAVILYATACNLTDGDLTGKFDLLQAAGAKSGGVTAEEAEDEEQEGEDEAEPEAEESGSKSEFKLHPWNRRPSKALGMEMKGGRPIPLIDMAHKLMHLWKAGDVAKVNEYIDARGLRKNPLFVRVLQALIELSGEGTQERAMLESISNHLKSLGVSATTLFE